MTYQASSVRHINKPKCGVERSRRCSALRDREADRVLALVSAHDRVPAALLLHRSRCRAPIARSRQLAMYLMHTLLGRTMTEVGLYFGRDRTTVAHACGRIEDQRDDLTFDSAVSALEERLTDANGLWSDGSRADAAGSGKHAGGDVISFEEAQHARN